MKKTIKQCTRNENYFISSNGEVFTKLKNGELKEMKLAENNSGYLYCNLNNQRHNFIAELVYETFVGNIPTGFEINHKNGNKKDNRVNNLQLTTHKENCLLKEPSLIPSFKVTGNGKYQLKFSMLGEVIYSTHKSLESMLIEFENLRNLKIKLQKKLMKKIDNRNKKMAA